jgi:hypothetical protein
MFSNKLGLLLLRLGWRPGKPSIPLGGVMFIDCCNQICQPKCQTCVLIPVGLGSKKGFHGTIYSYQMLVDANNFSFHVQFHQKRIMKIWSRFTLIMKSSIHSSSKEGLKNHNN